MANEVSILVRVKDAATGAIKQIKTSLGQLTGAADKANAGAKKLGGEGLGGIADSALGLISKLGAVAAALGVVTVGFKKAFDGMEEGAQMERLQTASTELAESMSLDMQEIVDAVRTASLNTVSDMDIMTASAKALAMEVGGSSEQIADLWEAAAYQGRLLGMSASEAFEKIVQAIGKVNPSALENLGIIIDVSKAYQDYGATISKQGDRLTDFEKKQALVNAVIADSSDALSKSGGLTEDSAAKFEQMGAAYKNLVDAVKTSNATLGGEIASGFTWIFNSAAELVTYLDKQGKALDALEEQYIAGVIDIYEYSDGVNAVYNATGTLAERTSYYNSIIEETEEKVSGTNDQLDRQEARMRELPGVIEGAGKSLSHFGLVSEQVAFQVDNFLEKAGLFAADFGEMFTIGENFTEIIGLAKNYTNELRDLEEVNSRILQLNAVYAEGGGYFEGEYWSVKKLTDELTKLNGTAIEIQAKIEAAGNQMTLDMLENALLIDGIMSEQEYTAYMNLAVELGEIDRTAADLAIAQFSESLSTVTAILELTFETQEIDTYTPPRKVGEVDYAPNTSKVDSYQPPNKFASVIYTPQFVGAGQTQHPASGMAVFTGAAKAAGGGMYTVGEIGPEPFFPATNGRILSNNEAKSAMRSNYRQGGGDTVNVIINTPVNLADRVWVERELEPYIRKALRQARA